MRVVVLPEKTFAADGKSLPLVATPLSHLAAEHHVDIIVGLVLTQGGDERNAAIDFPADGSSWPRHDGLKWPHLLVVVGAGMVVSA